jgi:hypothetical protein
MSICGAVGICCDDEDAGTFVEEDVRAKGFIGCDD